MAAPTPSPLLPFPQNAELARNFYVEAMRHLQDARVLHVNARYPASITSAMKSVELGLKSILYMHGAAGWLQDALKAHDVMTRIATTGEATKVFREALRQQDTALITDIQEMEHLVPSLPNVSNLSREKAANTEYPFFADMPGQGFQLLLPGDYFTQAHSAKYFGTARRLLLCLPEIAPEIRRWGVRLCRSL